MTNDVIEIEKVSPYSEKLVKGIKGKCDTCCPKKSQFFTE